MVIIPPISAKLTTTSMSSYKIKHKTTRYIALEILVLTWDRHKYMAELNHDHIPANEKKRHYRQKHTITKTNGNMDCAVAVSVKAQW